MSVFLKVPFFVLLFLASIFMEPLMASVKSDPLKFLPVQAAGRVKPYDTLARESLQLLYGKQSYHGRAAAEVVFTWILTPEVWFKKEFVEINRRDIKKSLKLDEKRKHFSPLEVFENPRLNLLIQELQGQREAKVKLDPFYQGVSRLENQLFTFRAIASGGGVRVLPPQPNGESTSWLSLDQLDKDFQEAFKSLTSAFLGVIAFYQENGEESENREDKAEEKLEQAVDHFMTLARKQNPQAYPTEGEIEIEVHYNDLQPFLWSWILYLLAAVFWGFALKGGRRWSELIAWGTMAAGFLMHIYGFALRVYLTGRPPVSNMYETVVWVSFGVVLFAMILGRDPRKKMVLLAGSVVGLFSLIVAWMAPTILDASLQPLEPVLRSNLWLTVHVLTITISYAAFFLAFGLADVGLFYYLRGEKESSPRIRSLADSIYRCLQIGVVLLAAGTILGGVWADYSWGRFWGWDPKETWALIALLGYLAMLHGRIAGWLGHFGMLVGSILSFSLVIMAWYGVNYVLGAGLHSYGFGGGGLEYVSIFVGLHFLYVIAVYTVRKERQKLEASS